MRWTTSIIVGLALAGCDSSTGSDAYSATDAVVDRAPTAEPIGMGPSISPVPAEPSMPIGGGPSAGQFVYPTSNALHLLSSARCEHAMRCGVDATGCEAEAAREHGDELAQCENGVRSTPLKECATKVRDAACESFAEVPETCAPEVLCASE
jgi:hypothetical protein